MPKQILIADDDEDLRRVLRGFSNRERRAKCAAKPLTVLTPLKKPEHSTPI
jgi:hypothetical protein